jgi:hypothetical protein
MYENAIVFQVDEQRDKESCNVEKGEKVSKEERSYFAETTS